MNPLAETLRELAVALSPDSSNFSRNMYPKTLQCLMGHSDISVTMNTYTHLGQGGRGGRNEPDAAAGKRQEGAGSAKRKDGRGEAFEEAFPGRITGKNDDAAWSDPAGFLLPGFSFYGILCQERNGSQGIPSSKLEGILLLFYYF